jgi:hypothetical protein
VSARCLRAVLAYTREEIAAAGDGTLTRPNARQQHMIYSKRSCGRPLVAGETICRQCRDEIYALNRRIFEHVQTTPKGGTST